MFEGLRGEREHWGEKQRGIKGNALSSACSFPYVAWKKIHGKECPIFSAHVLEGYVPTWSVSRCSSNFWSKSLCFGSQLRGDVRWKMGKFHPRMIVLIVYLKKKKTMAFISVLCLPSCSGGMLFYPVRGAQTFPAGNIKIYRRINILLCLKIYMSKWKGKQEHWKNMALSRADHWKGVRMKFYWEETLKTWNHKKVFLHTAIASLYLSTVIFHCLVVPLCVYLHLNQPSLWWRTALHVSRLLLGKHHFRIIECLNVLGRKFSDFFFVCFIFPH